MGDAVEQGAGEAIGAEDLGPLLEGQVAGEPQPEGGSKLKTIAAANGS